MFWFTHFMYPVAVEVAVVLSRILGKRLAKAGFERLILNTKEIYPFCSISKENIFYTATSNLYFERCIENSLKLGRIPKTKTDSWVPGWKDRKDEVMLSGMDIFVLSYAQLKRASLLTNDWSLWYVAWKLGLNAYWLKGLGEQETLKLAKGEAVEYPVKPEP